jgi:outer membrane lipoprotein-sorting protein
MLSRFVTLLVCAAALGAARQPGDPLDALFARGRAMQATLRTVSASFTETTVSSLLRDPLVARGTVIAAVPLRMLMTYTTPEVRYVLMDQTRLVTVVPARREREELNIADMQRRIQRYFVDASPKDLRQSFDIELAPDAAMPGTDLMDMKPRRKQIREGLARLRLWIDRANLTMSKLRMDYADGDSRTIELSDIKINVPVDDRTFTIPSGRSGQSGGDDSGGLIDET